MSRMVRLAILAIVAAAPGFADQPAEAAAASRRNSATRSMTLPGSTGISAESPASASSKIAAEPESNGSLRAPGTVAAGVSLPPTAGEGEASQHYRAAILALKDENLAIAADEMNEAARLSPADALVLYGLAVVESRNQQPEKALPAIEKSMQLGLPEKESARADDLIASIRYAIRKNEAEQKRVTPTKLWGSYDVPFDDPVQDTETLPGHTLFKTRLPVSREMFLWQIDGNSNIRGHWLEKNTYTEQISYISSKRRDPEPKVSTEEHWWIVSILINPDGSLDGSRIETCFRHPAAPCEHDDPQRGKIITFKGRVEPNGDLTIVQDGSKGEMALHMKSRVTSLPPSGVGIHVD
ncbi:MAG: hypothetical protein LAP40_00980 [Acidobacteriia bacterium]|nr:hypothetical protein [Terriglobia bacterium]